MLTKNRRGVYAVLSALAVALTSTSLALAATAPTATTAPASNVTATAATLNGIVAPNKTPTTYYFQYGTSTAYGSQTPSASANGNASKAVSAGVSGLTASHTYHFRLVATSAGGTSQGADATFTTAASGAGGPSKNSVSIGSIPHTITWGRTAQIAGSVTGPGKAGQTVTLLASPYPYTVGFKPTGQVTTTSTAGAFTFTVQPGANSRYEVIVATKAPVTSSATGVGVHVRVVLHVSTRRPFRGQLVKFSGTVTPAHNGRFAQIQRRTSTGRWVTVTSTRLVAGGSLNGVPVSRYAKRIRIRHTGSYRVRVNPRDGDHLIGNSATRTERVR